MRNKYLILFNFIIVIFFSNCDKQGTSYTTAFVINKTNHKIEVSYLAGGKIIKSLVLNKHDSVLVGEMNSRGKATNGGFNSTFGNPDSAVVTFDGLYKMTHFNNNTQPLPYKGYLHDSKRNLGNYLSYEYNFIDETKHFRREFYRYIFNEQDYLDAL